jgi:hypothetical protein
MKALATKDEGIIDAFHDALSMLFPAPEMAVQLLKLNDFACGIKKKRIGLRSIKYTKKLRQLVHLIFY